MAWYIYIVDTRLNNIYLNRNKQLSNDELQIYIITIVEHL